MKLKELLDKRFLKSLDDDALTLEIIDVTADSRRVKPGSLFVAMAGPQRHGSQFIKQAIDQGAVAVICEPAVACSAVNPCVRIGVENPMLVLNSILKKFYRDPLSQMRLIGVTGTNGKTTLTYLMESIFAAGRLSCGVIGTVNQRWAGKTLKAGNTTPGVVENYEIFFAMRESGVKYCVMEVSSHALDQNRVYGFEFNCAVFTNLTSDHMDYHYDRESYFQAKAKLFSGLSASAYAVINIDDEYAKRLPGMTQARVLTYGIKTAADFSARGIKMTLGHSVFELVTPKGAMAIKTPFIGIHNIYNILAAAAGAYTQNCSLDTIRCGIENLRVVPGRLERIDQGQDYYVYVDYAHTQDALENVLTSLKNVSNAKLIVVFGCGGNRDRTKRPLMGEVVDRLAHWAIVTSDNPRNENPGTIINEVVAGFRGKNFEVIVDRREAIARALGMARKGDVVLIAGKGHEDYQIFHDRTIEFDERKIVRELLSR